MSERLLDNLNVLNASSRSGNHRREFTAIRESFSVDYCFDGVVLQMENTGIFQKESKLVYLLCSMDDKAFKKTCRALCVPQMVINFRNWWKDHSN